MTDRVVAGRYELLREVGRGGMATVYLARDDKHQREVALKAMRPDLAAVVGAERFLREIEITARLNHPHILPLLDSGTEDGLFYYVMPYVSGGSLRRLLDGGDLPLEAVVRITREVAGALDHAHVRDVIHRDVKPENILFNEGLAVVSDFGIAKAMSGADTGMTGTGLSVGTLGYMSPEQALGTAELDARSDVYSLGSVVYEMLVGETPAAWPGAEDVGLGRFEELPEAHRDRLDRYPGRVQQVLVRALALRPQHRFESAGELADALSAASGPTTRFSDENVRRLLRRAADLQADREPRPGDLTMGHVEQIAAQVGIPPEHVREAARELDRPADGATAGTPPAAASSPPAPTRKEGPGRPLGEWKHLQKKWDRLVAETAVDGEVPEAAFPAMVAEIQRQLGLPGHASVVAGNLTWSPVAQSEDTRRLVVQVVVEGGSTRVRVQEELGIFGLRRIAPPIGGVGGGAFGAALGEMLGAADPAQGVLILLCAAAGLVTAIRSVVAVDAGARASGLEALAESLAEIAGTALGGELPPGREPES